MTLRALFLLIALLCAGCASLPSQPGCIKIGPYGAVCLLPPAALPHVQARHVVTIKHGARQDTFLGRLSVNHEALRLAGASLFGTHLFSISWDGSAMVVEPPSDTLHPDLMVVMLEVALADPALLQPRLHGLTLTLKHDEDGNEIRELHEHGRLVGRIRISGAALASARLLITIPPAHLTLSLIPLQDAAPSSKH